MGVQDSVKPMWTASATTGEGSHSETAAEKPYLDKERVGALGASYGELITHSGMSFHYCLPWSTREVK